LYISAHPLDKYSTYFKERTVALSSLISDHDGLMVTVGGVINSVRTIVTKNGYKMAFVAVEDKTGEGEVVIFPSVFEKTSPILVVDKVVKFTGRVSGKDRNGNVDPDPKILAETVSEISDTELDSYKPTGLEMTIKQAKLAPARGRGGRAAETETAPRSRAKPAAPAPPPAPEAPPLKKLYLHIKNPDDATLLTKTKEILSKFIGDSEIVMVLGEDKKDALRLPFRAEISQELLAELEKIYDTACVVVK
jgi:hypothetical protein